MAGSKKQRRLAAAAWVLVSQIAGAPPSSAAEYALDRTSFNARDLASSNDTYQMATLESRIVEQVEHCRRTEDPSEFNLHLHRMVPYPARRVRAYVAEAMEDLGRKVSESERTGKPISSGASNHYGSEAFEIPTLARDLARASGRYRRFSARALAFAERHRPRILSSLVVPRAGDDGFEEDEAQDRHLNFPRSEDWLDVLYPLKAELSFRSPSDWAVDHGHGSVDDALTRISELYLRRDSGVCSPENPRGYLREEAAAASVNEKSNGRWAYTPIGHPWLHVPELMIAWNRGKGRSLQPIQEAFLYNEWFNPANLNDLNADLNLSSVGHLFESLGRLMDEDSITWTPVQQVEVAYATSIFLAKVRDQLDALDREDHGCRSANLSELVHLYEGLKRINRNMYRMESWPAVVAATPAPEATRTTAATHGARSAPRRPAGAGSSTRFTAAAAF